MKVKQLAPTATPKREVVRFAQDEVDRLVNRILDRGLVTLPYTARNTRLLATMRSRLVKVRVWVRTRSYTSGSFKVWFSTEGAR